MLGGVLYECTGVFLQVCLLEGSACRQGGAKCWRFWHRTKEERGGDDNQGGRGESPYPSDIGLRKTLAYEHGLVHDEIQNTM